MQLLSNDEINQITGGFYNEILIAAATLGFGFLCYEAWKLPPYNSTQTSDLDHDAYYEGAMQFLGNGGHCA